MSSGGLGREIGVLLRAASLPGSELVLPLLVNQPLIGAGRAVGRLLARVGLRVHTDVGEPRGQRVDASDRLYLAQAVLFLLMWGERDAIIPVEHARAAHRLVPGSRLEIFPDAGHIPHLDDPLRFVRLLLTDFMRTTEPAKVDSGRWRELLRSGGGESAPSPVSPAAVPRRWSARRAAGRSSTG